MVPVRTLTPGRMATLKFRVSPSDVWRPAARLKQERLQLLLLRQCRFAARLKRERLQLLLVRQCRVAACLKQERLKFLLVRQRLNRGHPQ